MSKSKIYINNRKAEEIGFNTFISYVQNNPFDKIAKDMIERHEKEIIELNEKDKKVRIGASDIFYDILFREEELKALSEMKIIYAYKHFETSLKFLINSTYKDFEKSKLYKWETISDILKSKNIDIRNIKGFYEIDELREVNNAIKHDTILKSRKLPKEFENKDFLTYKDIMSFYERVENSPVKFLKSLYEMIKIELYSFDEKRLEDLVNKIEKTMEPKIAVEFAYKILERY